MKQLALSIAALALAAGMFAETRLTPMDPAGFGKVIAAHRGKVVLVDFWATWCKPCRAQTPELAKLAAKLRGRGLELVTVSIDDPPQEAEALQVLSQDGISGAAYIKKAADDDKFFEAIDADWGGVVPAMFLYDRAGKKVRTFVGETPVAVIQTAVEKALGSNR